MTDVADQGAIQKRLCLHPEIVAGFAVSLGIADQGVDQLQNVLFAVDVGEGVIVHTLGKIDGIEYLDAVVVLLQQSAALDHDTAFWIGDDERNRIVFRLALHEIGLDEKARFSRT